MKHPSKKEIKDAVAKLKDQSSNNSNPEQKAGKLTPKVSTQRIRKQGV